MSDFIANRVGLVDVRNSTQIYPAILRFNSENWHIMVADLLQRKIEELILLQGGCTVMLTGGRSAERVYKSWSQLPNFFKLSGVNFYLSDERSVPIQSKDSNCRMILEALFGGGYPGNCKFFPMPTQGSNRSKAIIDYSNLLPDNIDILLLSMGEDGHVASIFPENSSLLQEKERKVVSVEGCTYPYERITITPKVISSSLLTFVMAEGDIKMQILANLINNPIFFGHLPAALLLDSTWIVNANFYSFCDLWRST